MTKNNDKKNMIGEHIKSLRLQKMMTQKELCGSVITRNMLSAIENGYANPSVDTLICIAERLNVSPGLLISDGENDLSLKKISLIDSIRQAYGKGSFSICIDLCSGLPEDDEINLILAKSYVAVAKEAFDRGDLHDMCRYFDRAVSHSSRSIYSDTSILAIASVYFRYVNAISSTLFSETISDARTWQDDIFSMQDEFCRYYLATDTLRQRTDICGLSNTLFSFSKPQYIKHIKATELMQSKRYEESLELLKELIYGQTELGVPIMYNIMREAEFCSKELNNYKDAYEFSNSCISLLDRILKQ